MSDKWNKQHSKSGNWCTDHPKGYINPKDFISLVLQACSYYIVFVSLVWLELVRTGFVQFFILLNDSVTITVTNL